MAIKIVAAALLGLVSGADHAKGGIITAIGSNLINNYKNTLIENFLSRGGDINQVFKWPQSIFMAYL